MKLLIRLIVFGLLILSVRTYISQTKVGVFVDPNLLDPNFIPYKDIVLKKEKPITVAVIDTGYSLHPLRNGFTPPLKSLCKTGHVNFVNHSYDIDDKHMHGTNISGVIDVNAGDAKYCQIILKYYDNSGLGYNNLKNEISAIRFAIDLKVDFINISSGGRDLSPEEKKLIVEALDKGITVVTAAGNESSDLAKMPYYPASYDKRIVVIGSTYNNGVHLKSSNYGNVVDYWEIGYEVEGNKIKMSGTSQATAVVTGKLIAKRWQELKKSH